MADAAAHVRSGQVTYAARDSEFDGKKIKQGEYLSLCEGKLCANGKESLGHQEAGARDGIRRQRVCNRYLRRRRYRGAGR